MNTQNTAANTPDTITDYGDLLASLVEKKKLKARQEALEKTAAAEAARLARVETLRPFITILRQVKERFPRVGIHGLDCHGSLHFYISGDMCIRIEHDGNAYKLRKQGGPNFVNSVIASSANPEDLIPTVMELLTECVTR